MLPKPLSFAIRLAMSVITIMLVLGITIKSIYLWRLKVEAEKITGFSYVGTDFPQEWPIQRDPVIMADEPSVHYDITSPEGLEEWRQLVPGDGLIHLGPQQSPYTISMLHELRCLDIIRKETVREQDEPTGGRTAELVHHCMNYLRQMMLCRSDYYLESFQDSSDTRALDLYETWMCKDWSSVYDAVRKNQEEFNRNTGSS